MLTTGTQLLSVPGVRRSAPGCRHSAEDGVFHRPLLPQPARSVVARWLVPHLGNRRRRVRTVPRSAVVCVKFCKIGLLGLLVGSSVFLSIFLAAVLWELWETAAGFCRRFPSPVGRRGFIAAFHGTAASIAWFLLTRRPREAAVSCARPAAPCSGNEWLRSSSRAPPRPARAPGEGSLLRWGRSVRPAFAV